MVLPQEIPLVPTKGVNFGEIALSLAEANIFGHTTIEDSYLPAKADSH
jgi:hypothetical protein